MKKKLVASLAAAMVLGVAGTSFAASNPFVDVPVKHWSYDAVTKLAQAGIVDGYGDGKFQGDKMISRYEMAQLTAKAMARSDKANASQKAMIDKLAAEYKTELEGLNVRVSNVEKKVSVLERVEMNGNARIRYDHLKDAGVKNQNVNLDLFMNFKVNDSWTIKSESEWNKDLRNGGQTNTGFNDQFEQLYVTGPIGGATVKAGRFSYTPTYGLTFDNKVSGAQITFGNVLKASLNVGNDTNNLKHEAIDFVWAYSKDTNVKANYQKFSLNSVDTKIYEVGFDTKLGPDFGFQAAYAKSDVDTDNKSYFAQIQYKVADTKVVGSSDVYLAYRKSDKFSYISTSGDYFTNSYTSFKGIRIGYDYVPAKNIKFGAFYQVGKTTDGSNVIGTTSEDIKLTRAQVEFFF